MQNTPDLPETPKPAATQESPEQIRELQQRITAARRQLGPRAVVLAHHYQSDEIVEQADFVGDSLQLARIAAEQSEAEWIIFCGVHFMAESADILTAPERKVLLPERSAGCPMADMATGEQFQRGLDELNAMAGGATIVPVTYVNSTAAVKAVTGRAGGACCTSGNAASVVRWALGQAKGTGEAGPANASSEAQGISCSSVASPNPGIKVFAAPDQHLIRATALDMGYKLEDCVIYDPRQPHGGLNAEALARATFVLWDGECTVHQIFTAADVAARRAELPGVHVIVHPECEISVVMAADEHGSTAQIIKAVDTGEPSSRWAVGTEDALVSRLAAKYADRQIVNLSPWRLTCMNMQKIRLAHLAAALDDALAGRLDRRITVDDATADDARSALDRMIHL